MVDNCRMYKKRMKIHMMKSFLQHLNECGVLSRDGRKGLG